MRPRQLLALLSLSAVVFAFGAIRPAFALITVDPGSYEVPAFLAPSEQGPVAVFNWNTRSECRILLTGKTAKSLDLKHPKIALIKISVKKKIDGMRGSAVLVGIKPLGKRHLPRSVSNNLEVAR